jgi:hypothetical protein
LPKASSASWRSLLLSAIEEAGCVATLCKGSGVVTSVIGPIVRRFICLLSETFSAPPGALFEGRRRGRRRMAAAALDAGQ